MSWKTFVRDPITASFHVLPMKGGGVMNILIFGEWHRKKTECPRMSKNDRIISVGEFVLELGSHFPNKPIDILTESVYPIPSKTPYLQQKRGSDWVFGLGFFRNFLDRCAKKYVRDQYRISFHCPRNFRIHLCDVRLISAYPFHGLSRRRRTTDAYKLLAEYFDYSHRDEKDVDSKFYDYWRQTLFEKNSPHFVERVFAMGLDKLKINRQMDHIRTKQHKKILMEWGVSEWITHVESARQAFVGQNLNALQDAIINMNTVFIDLYLMGRMLRRFSDGSIVRNAIIYTGEYHSHHYRLILDRIGAETVFSSIPNNVAYNMEYLAGLPACVDMTPFLKLMR